MDESTRYINRELSLIAFNQRVLMLANDPRIPLLERMRLLSICSSNLDEFYEIRVAGVKEQILRPSGKLSIDGLTPTEVDKRISEKVHELIQQLYEIFNQHLLPALHKEKIHFLDTHQWTEEIHAWSKRYFKQEILPILSPIALDLAHPLPRLINKSLNFIISLSGKDAFERVIDYAVVHAPRSIPRMIRLPLELTKNQCCFVYLSSIIKVNVSSLFPGMSISGCYAFRLTRNSDLSLTEEMDDLAKAVQREIFSRNYGSVVRLEIEKNCPEKIMHFLLKKFHLTKDDTFLCDGPLNLQRYMGAINSIHRPDLDYPRMIPSYPKFPATSRNLFDVIDEQDILLHHPYQSFEVVTDFVRQAAKDPHVLAIHQTLYRLPTESLMVDALIDAAHAGKEVTAVIELRARFNEESNLKFANRLQNAGILVLYGVVNYKTHAKMTIVVRRTHEKLKNYVHLSTGNYHERTAKRYTDLGLLTCDPTITSDVQLIFQQLTGLGKVVKLKALSHSPFTLQKTLLQFIERCTTAATSGLPAEIFMKANGLTDKVIIDALYAASQAGVTINLIIRGVCCLKPGIPGMSEKIKVRSIIGRFLEHHRVFYFKIGLEEFYYCASADLMERNLYQRIEVMFPILAPHCQKKIKNEIINNYLKDNSYAWEMQSDGRYLACTQQHHSAQETLIEKYKTDIDDR